MVALERAGINVDTYYASEIDPNAIKISRKNYPHIVQLGDVTKWREWDIDWSSVDLLIGGSPCQGFSFAGKQLNFEDNRSKLFFVYADILSHIQDINPNIKFLLENVKMKQEYEDVISNFLGCSPILIDSINFVPQIRKRLYWCNFKVCLPTTFDSRNVNDILISGVSTDNKAATIKYQYYKSSIANYIRKGSFHATGVLDDGKYRKLYPIECERLQGLPDNYTEGLSNTQRYMCIGNGWTVDVIAHILHNIKTK